MSRRNEPPVASYRLQLGPRFTLAEAAHAVPSLAALGISHLYLSPIFSAAPGSTHGYDVIDANRVSEELGGIEALYSLDAALRAHDMGLILDIVPNHIGVAGALNPWWRDLLRFGQRSEFAAFFDIDWHGQPQMPSGVLVYPCLGRPFGAALEAGELTVGYDGNELVLRHNAESLPLAPATYIEVLGLPDPALADGLAEASALPEFARLLEGLRTSDPSDAVAGTRRLASLLSAEPALLAWVEQRTAEINGSVGDPSSFDRLEVILAAQAYRLAYWRVSGEEINYRRFFDVNSLAALRVEDPQVFTATHQLVARLVESGIATGLRVDHVDGLYAPGEYLGRLQDLVRRAAPSGQGEFPIWVEKILARREALPAWPVAGSTGYEFLAVCGELLVSPAGTRALAKTYDGFADARHSYDDIAYAARKHVAERSFAGEVTVLALQLHRLSQRDRLYRDNTLAGLREAIAALIACFPVYRTYFEDEDAAESEAAWIRAAATRAVLRDPDVTPEAMDLLTSVLLLSPGPESESDRTEWLHFRRRFQQVSAPVMAKGVEDTTLFRYSRLLSLNDVGCAADSDGISSEEAHTWFSRRAAEWPAAMSATSTHDTKRSEDVRNRIAVLSEFPREWGVATRTWSRLNQGKRRHANGREVPDAETEYYLYQTLVGAWEGVSDDAFMARIEEHMTKAVREAKRVTSWMRVDEPYELALSAFVRDILGTQKRGGFLAQLDRFVGRLRPGATIHSLATLTLKCTAPGFPDFYQGSENPLFQLTDPDNRQPLDLQRLERATLSTAQRPAPVDPESKAWLTKSLLALRSRAPRVFSDGSYSAVEATGDRAANLFCFTRESADSRVLVVVPRVASLLLDGDGLFLPGALGNTALSLSPEAGCWENWLTGEKHGAQAFGKVSEILRTYPIAELTQGVAV
ncbi:MAG: malto-oligosyltrehalose synthase [Tepidiformaceae bacterium]